MSLPRFLSYRALNFETRCPADKIREVHGEEATGTFQELRRLREAEPERRCDWPEERKPDAYHTL